MLDSNAILGVCAQYLRFAQNSACASRIDGEVAHAMEAHTAHNKKLLFSAMNSGTSQKSQAWPNTNGDPASGASMPFGAMAKP